MDTKQKYDNKQILHATVLDIKVYYYLMYAVFHEAPGWVEYYHSQGSNKPDIQHSKSAIFVLLYSLYVCIQNCVRALTSETMHSPFIDSATVTI